MGTYTLQPSAGDTYIRSGTPTDNYGSSATLFIGLYSSSILRILAKFDLSSIPAAEICNSAILSLWISNDYSIADVTWKVYRLKRDWVEAQATWNVYSTGNNWGTAGGMGAADIDTTELGTSGTVVHTTAVNTEIQIELFADEIEKMFNGTYDNYGFLIKATTETGNNNAWMVYSEENAADEYHPKLTIVTSVPSSGNPVADVSNYGIL